MTSSDHGFSSLEKTEIHHDFHSNKEGPDLKQHEHKTGVIFLLPRSEMIRRNKIKFIFKIT